MSLPWTQVFPDFFALYDITRKPDRESTLSMLKDKLETVSSMVTNIEPTILHIQKIQDEVMSVIEQIEAKADEDKFELWFDLIFALGMKAKTAQELRIFNDPKTESLFCETLHALRNIIIYALTESDDIYQKCFKKFVSGLKSLAQELEDKLYYVVNKDKGQDAEAILNHLNDITIKLALLGDTDAIIEARKNKLFPYLHVYPAQKLIKELGMQAKDANPFKPYCLQDDFCVALYQIQYQKIKKISFDEYLNEIKKQHKAKHVSEIDEEKLNKIIELKIESLRYTTTPINTAPSYHLSKTPSDKNLVTVDPNLQNSTKITDFELPCPQVFINFFKLYDSERAADRNSVLGFFVNTWQRATSYFTGKEPTVQEIENIKSTTLSEIETIHSAGNEKAKFDIWFKLIFKLDELAKKAQECKYLQNSESLFCLTLHALRSYVLSVLTTKNSPYNKWFEIEMNTLRKSAGELNQKLYNSVHQQSGRDGDKILEEYEKTTIKLALLEDKDAIIGARKGKLIEHLKLHDHLGLTSRHVPAGIANPFIPYALHEKFATSLYKAVYQKHKNVAYEKFITDSVLEYKQAQQVQKIEAAQNAAASVNQEADISNNQLAASSPTPASLTADPMRMFKSNSQTCVVLFDDTAEDKKTSSPSVTH